MPCTNWVKPFSKVPVTHKHTLLWKRSILDEIPFINGIKLDEGKILKDMFVRLSKDLSAQNMTLQTLTTQEVTAVVDFTAVDEQTMKVWEVLFDVRSGPTSGGNRIDPLIFDLNMDGKFDITGKNQTGDGELTGPTVQFDMDPNRQSWRHNSPGHRPGTYHNGRNNSKAPGIPNGYAVYDSGKREKLWQGWDLGRGCPKRQPCKDLQCTGEVGW